MSDEADLGSPFSGSCGSSSESFLGKFENHYVTETIQCVQEAIENYLHLEMVKYVNDMSNPFRSAKTIIVLSKAALSNRNIMETTNRCQICNFTFCRCHITNVKTGEINNIFYLT